MNGLRAEADPSGASCRCDLSWRSLGTCVGRSDDGVETDGDRDGASRPLHCLELRLGDPVRRPQRHVRAHHDRCDVASRPGLRGTHRRYEHDWSPCGTEAYQPLRMTGRTAHRRRSPLERFGVASGQWSATNPVHKDAYRSWVPRLPAAAPTLVTADSALRAVVITAVPGQPLHGLAHPPEQQQHLFHQIGALAAAIHRSAAGPFPTAEGVPALAKVERHLEAARPYLNPGDEKFIRSTVARAEGVPPLDRVPTHGDFQLRNLLLDQDGSLAVIDFERSEPGPAIRDLVRLADAWATQPRLCDAFMAGYGRELTPAEEERFVIDSALDALSGIQYGTTHSDAETQDRGHRTLARLRAQDHPQ